MPKYTPFSVKINFKEFIPDQFLGSFYNSIFLIHIRTYFRTKEKLRRKNESEAK